MQPSGYPPEPSLPLAGGHYPSVIYPPAPIPITTPSNVPQNPTPPHLAPRPRVKPWHWLLIVLGLTVLATFAVLYFSGR